MIQDRFIGTYITSVKHKLEELKQDVITANFDDMYQVGKLQGCAAGLKLALELLEAAYEDLDK